MMADCVIRMITLQIYNPILELQKKFTVKSVKNY